MRYSDAGDVPVVIARTFNLLGPGLPTDLACGAFVDRIVRIEQGAMEPPLRTGNLSARRDFTDVRDVVRAYRLLAELGSVGGVYNVCSGLGVSVEQTLGVLLEHAIISIPVERDPAMLQAHDIPRQTGDSRRLHARTGWQPVIALRQSLLDMLDQRRGGSQG
jgi:GDP-4-dehydro-6-deoxy-D-mannose reductase